MRSRILISLQIVSQDFCVLSSGSDVNGEKIYIHHLRTEMHVRQNDARHLKLGVIFYETASRTHKYCANGNPAIVTCILDTMAYELS